MSAFVPVFHGLRDEWGVGGFYPAATDDGKRCGSRLSDTDFAKPCSSRHSSPRHKLGKSEDKFSAIRDGTPFIAYCDSPEKAGSPMDHDRSERVYESIHTTLRLQIEALFMKIMKGISDKLIIVENSKEWTVAETARESKTPDVRFCKEFIAYNSDYEKLRMRLLLNSSGFVDIYYNKRCCSSATAFSKSSGVFLKKVSIVEDSVRLVALVKNKLRINDDCKLKMESMRTMPFGCMT